VGRGLHSHLSEGERHDEWHKIHGGPGRGHRGGRGAVAVFRAARKISGSSWSMKNHETSYKTGGSGRAITARDCRGRARRRWRVGAVLLRGRATPVAREFITNAGPGEQYRLLKPHPTRGTTAQDAADSGLSICGLERRKEKIAPDSFGKAAGRDHRAARETRTKRFCS